MSRFRRLLTLTLLLGAALTRSEPMFLVDEGGRRFGPFDFQNGAILPVNGHTYRVSCWTDDAATLVAALKATPLPRFEFANIQLADIVRHVRENAAKQNPALAGVLFTVVGVAEEGQPASPAKPAPQGDAAVPTMRVALQMTSGEGASAWDILNLATELFGYRVDVHPGEVRLLDPRVPDGPLFARTLSVFPTLWSRIDESRREKANERDPFGIVGVTPIPEADLKAFFSELGVSWPIGSGARGLIDVNRLIVINTLPNLRTMETILAPLCETRLRQVEVELQFVAVPKLAIDKVTRRGRVPSEAVFALLEDGTAKVLASPKVVTGNGTEATIKGVVEYIYPTAFTVERTATAADPAVANTVEPGGFETREVGVILQVVPDVTPDNAFIQLTLCPQTVYPPAWRNYAVAADRPAAATTPRAPMEQPFFPVNSVTTTVQIRNGGTLVIGGGTPTPDGQSFIYQLLSAKLIDAEGRDAPATPREDVLIPVPPPLAPATVAPDPAKAL